MDQCKALHVTTKQRLAVHQVHCQATMFWLQGTEAQDDQEVQHDEQTQDQQQPPRKPQQPAAPVDLSEEPHAAIMMTRKAKGLYNAMQRGIKAKRQRVDELERKKQALAHKTA